MSGGGAGEFLKKNWHGLPIGDALLSPKWIKAHPKETMAAAAVAATVYTGGAAAGLWGGLGALGAGAGAAGAGGLAAAEGGAGAAAAAGSGLAAADYAAMGLGSTALAGSAAPAALYAGELASVGEAGGAGLLGGAPAHAVFPVTSNPLSYLSSNAASVVGPDNLQMASNGLGKATDAFKMYSLAQGVAQQFTPPQAKVATRPPPQYDPKSGDAIRALLEEIYKRQGA